MEIYKLQHTGPQIDEKLHKVETLEQELAEVKDSIDINLENGAGEKSLQTTGIAEASGINAVALGGLRYDYFAYKYSWEFSVQLPNSKYSTHYGYYYKNTEEEYAAVSSADSTNIADQQIIDGGKYMAALDGGATEYTTSLTSAVIAEDGTIVSAPIITFTDAEGTVYTADVVESPYLGRVKTTAAGNQSFAAGGSTYAWGDWSVAFGKDTAAYQKASFAEGGGTIAGDPEGENTYSFAHAEGEATKAIGRSSHSEGNNTQATGAQAHAENYMTVASGQHSHAEGSETSATAKAAHSEGYKTTASGTYSHAEGNRTEATNDATHAEGNSTHATAQHAHAEGYNTTASGPNSHAEGYVTTASGESAHTEGLNTKAIGNGSHAEGYLGEATGLYSHVEGNGTKAQGDHSHAEGQNNTTKSKNSHVEGLNNTINENSDNSHAEGSGNTISSKFAHAEGSSNKVSGESSHAEGYGNTVIGAQSHAEGGSNEVHGAYGHAEGNKNISKNWFSHVEGSDNQALHSNSHVGGKGNISGQNSQTVIGEYNKVDSNALFVIGNGDAPEANAESGKKGRSNAMVVSKSGDCAFAGKVTSGGIQLTTEADVDKQISDIRISTYNLSKLEIVCADGSYIGSDGYTWYDHSMPIDIALSSIADNLQIGQNYTLHVTFDSYPWFPEEDEIHSGPFDGQLPCLRLYYGEEGDYPYGDPIESGQSFSFTVDQELLDRGVLQLYPAYFDDNIGLRPLPVDYRLMLTTEANKNKPYIKSSLSLQEAFDYLFGKID